VQGCKGEVQGVQGHSLGFGACWAPHEISSVGAHL